MYVEPWTKTIRKMTEEQKEIERLKRNVHNLELELKSRTKEMSKVLEEQAKLREIEVLFVTVRKNIKMIVKKYKHSYRKPPYYRMFEKLDKQIDEELDNVNEKETISF